MRRRDFTIGLLLASATQSRLVRSMFRADADMFHSGAEAFFTVQSAPTSSRLRKTFAMSVAGSRCRGLRERSCQVLDTIRSPASADRSRTDLPDVDPPHDVRPAVDDRQHRVCLLRRELAETATFRMVASTIISTSVVAWLSIVILSLPLAVGAHRCSGRGWRQGRALTRRPCSGFSGRRP